MANPDVKKRLVNQVFEQIEKQYAQIQREEASQLHNALVGVIGEQKPSHESILLVLELLKQEVLGNLINRFEEVKEASARIVKETPPEPPEA